MVGSTPERFLFYLYKRHADGQPTQLPWKAQSFAPVNRFTNLNPGPAFSPVVRQQGVGHHLTQQDTIGAELDARSALRCVHGGLGLSGWADAV